MEFNQHTGYLTTRNTPCPTQFLFLPEELIFSSVPYSQRVDTVLQWLALPADERPYLVFLYLEGVDSYGHTYGPDSFEVVRAIEEADTAIGRLLDGLESLSQASSVNMIVLSDHGMAQIM